MSKKIVATLKGRILKVDGKVLTIEVDDEYQIANSDSYDVTSDLEIPTTKAVYKMMSISELVYEKLELNRMNDETSNSVDFLPSLNEFAEGEKYEKVDKIIIKNTTLTWNSYGQMSVDSIIFRRQAHVIYGSAGQSGLMFTANGYDWTMYILISDFGAYLRKVTVSSSGGY